MLTVPKPKDTFDFQVEGSETVYSIPFAEDLPADYAKELTRLQDADTEAALDFFQKLMDRFAPGAWETLSLSQLYRVFEAWSGKGNLGER